VLPNYGQDRSTQEGAQAKRQRPLDLPGPSAKRSKIQPSVSFAEITKDRVLPGLIDRGNPEGRIPRNKWKAVESSFPSYACAWCEKSQVHRPAVWTLAGTRAVSQWWPVIVSGLLTYTSRRRASFVRSSKPRARTWLPAAIKALEDILYLLQKCNPHLPTNENLFDFILNSNLFLCNRGNVPTFITKTCQTIIDLTLVSDSLVVAVKLPDEHPFSDHRFIFP